MAEDTAINKIEKALLLNNQGKTIQQLVDITGLARGTVKAHLDELLKIGRVHEEEYGQNTKVFFLNGKGQYQNEIKLGNNAVLFIDVMTDPWKRPFVRIKMMRAGKDIGAIFLNDEENIEKLRDVLLSAKPKLESYRKIIKKMESESMMH